MNALTKKVKLLFFFLPVLYFSGDIYGQVLFEDGFESGNFNHWKEHIEGSASRIEICSTRARSGEYSVRFVTENTRRAELTGAPYSEFFWGNEYWIGFSFYSEIPVGGAKIIYQHHSTPGGRDWKCPANPNSFTIKNSGKENILFNTSTDASRVNAVPTEGGATKYTDETSYKASTKRWHDIVMNFRDNPDSSGFIKVWLNGELVMDHKGINVYLKDGCGKLRDPRQYMKIGLYPAVDGANGEIYFDEIRIGNSNASYEDVKPRGEIKEVTATSNFSRLIKDNVTFFLDPAKSELCFQSFTILNEQFELIIMALDGRIFNKSEVTFIDGKSNIKLNEIPPGIYLVSLINNHVQISSKVLKI